MSSASLFSLSAVTGALNLGMDRGTLLGSISILGVRAGGISEAEVYDPALFAPNVASLLAAEDGWEMWVTIAVFNHVFLQCLFP